MTIHLSSFLVNLGKFVKTIETHPERFMRIAAMNTPRDEEPTADNRLALKSHKKRLAT